MVIRSRGTRRPKLSRAQLIKRARQVVLVLTDNDGVLTDTGVYYDENGEAFKRFSIRDGMGVELLRREGIETAIITSENSPSVRRRSEKLMMKRLFLGVKDKRKHLETILKDTGLAVNQLAYIGDDVNDLAIIEEIGKEGLTGAPADAMTLVRNAAHYSCNERGGNGAFRDFAEWILRLRDRRHEEASAVHR